MRLMLLLLLAVPGEIAPPALPLRVLRGQAGASRFGESLCLAGDVDGDGFPDLAVGAPGRRGEAGPLSGAVFLFSGTTGNPLGVFEGEGPFHRFGRALAFGSFSREKTPDLAVGAPFFRFPGGEERGRVYLYETVEKRLLRTFDGPDGEAWYGFSLEIMDLNGDGREDLAAGAPVFSGRNGRASGAVFVHSGADGSLLYRVEGERAGDGAGYALACMDVDADGGGDLLIGVPGWDGPDGMDQGCVIAWSGRGDRPFYRRTGPAGIHRFGSALTVLPDLTGDGIQEFAAGGAVEEAGGFFVCEGRDGRLLYALSAENGAALAAGIAGTPDENGDGVPDLLGAACGSGKAEVLLFSGKDGRILDRRPVAGRPEGLGRTIYAFPDGEYTGYPRFALSARPFRNTGADLPGEVLYLQLAPPWVLRRVDTSRDGLSYPGALCFAGDLDGDHVPDLLVGDGSAATQAGEGAGKLAAYSAGGGRPLFLLEGVSRGSALGFSLASLPDMDGDGRPDFLAGAPGFSWKDHPGSGRVSLFSTRAGVFQDDRIKGSTAGAALGAAMAVLRASTGGAPGKPAFYLLLAAPGEAVEDRDRAGTVYLCEAPTFKVLRRFEGEESGARLGEVIVPAGDLDRDGTEDFFCTRWYYRGRPPRPDAPAKKRGRAREVLALSPFDGEPLFTLRGTPKDGRFGAAVLALHHDLDGRGSPELVVGVPGHEGTKGPSQGCVYLYAGEDGAPLAVVEGASADARLGERLVSLGDLDGDGAPEIAAGSPGAEGAGSVYILSSVSLRPLGMLRPGKGTKAFGRALASAGKSGESGALLAAAGEGALLLFSLPSPFPTAPEAKDLLHPLLLKVGPRARAGAAGNRAGPEVGTGPRGIHGCTLLIFSPGTPVSPYHTRGMLEASFPGPWPPPALLVVLPASFPSKEAVARGLAHLLRGSTREAPFLVGQGFEVCLPGRDLSIRITPSLQP